MNDDMTPPETAHINDTEITPEIVAEHGLNPMNMKKSLPIWVERPI